MHEIGSKVGFIRSDEKGAIIEGEGILQALFLQDGRVMAQVKNSTGAWNVFAGCLDPDEKMREDFTAGMIRVQQLTDEGNGEIKKTQARYQELVDDVYDRLLGVPNAGTDA